MASIGDRLRPLLARARATLDGPDGDSLVFIVGYVALLPLYLTPLLATRLLPGLDLPFHLSMADMLAKSGRPDSPYAPFYTATSLLAPYDVHYLALIALGPVLPIMVAHKVLIALYVAALPLGSAALLGGCGRSRVPALLAFPLAYNISLHYGFISFALSLPVLLFFLAALVRFLATPTRTAWVVTGLAGALLFLCHLQNFLYGLAAATAFLVFTPTPRRRRLAALATFAPALAVLAGWRLLSGPPAKGLAEAWHALKWARLGDLDFGKRSLARDFADRLGDLPESFLRGFADRIDVQAARALLALIALYFGAGLATRHRPARSLAVWGAFGAALFAYLALPHHLPEFEIMTLFPRFSPLVVLMMLPLVPAGLARLRGGFRLALPLPAFLLVALYGRALVERYRLYGVETSDFLAVVERAEPGRRALGLPFDRHSRVMRVGSALAGLASFYPVLRPAPGSMTPLAYCGMRHIPCRARQPVPDPGSWGPQALDADHAIPFFDYFFVRSPPPDTDLFRRQPVDLVDHQGTWWLYRARVPRR